MQISDSADQGWRVISTLWNNATQEHRAYCNKWDKDAWDGIRARAMEADKPARERQDDAREPGQEG